MVRRIYRRRGRRLTQNNQIVNPYKARGSMLPLMRATFQATKKMYPSLSSAYNYYRASKYDQKIKDAYKRNEANKKIYKTSDKVQEDTGSGGDVTRSSVKFALTSRKSKRYNVSKLVRSSEQKIVNVFRGLSPFLNTTNGPLNGISTEVGAGAYWLHNYTSNASTTLPVHIYDITSTNNVVSGTVAPYNPSFQLNSSNSIYNFSKMACQNSNGSTITTGWVAENVPGLQTGGLNYPNKRGLLESINVKMYCYGANSNATQWDVSLIQLKDQTLSPHELNLGLVSLTGREQTNKDSFWQYMSSKQASHPIDNLDPMNRKQFKVLKSFNFVLQPRLTNEVETMPHQKELSLWIPMNRICRYDWSDTTKVSSFAAGQFQSSVALVDNVVHPRARIYLIVRATNCTPVTSPAVETFQSTPSYDLILRQKQVIIE